MVIFTGPILPLPTVGVGNPYQNFSWTQLHDTLTEKVQQNDDLPVVPYMGMYMPPIILVTPDICLVLLSMVSINNHR